MPLIMEKTLGKLPRPATGNKLYFYDGRDPVRGFAVRVMASGAISFVLCYRMGSRQRRFTIGVHPEWSLADARDKAEELRKGIREGCDPLDARSMQRDSPTVKDLCERYLTDHAERHKRPKSVKDDRAMCAEVTAKLGNLLVADATKQDIEDLHWKRRATPVKANRIVAMLSTMFNLAIEWKWRADNPAYKITRNAETPRDTWMQKAELDRLTDALDAYPYPDAANAIRLLILTGARKMEVLSSVWWQFDLKRGTWTKPSSHTKQKKTEHVYLSDATVLLLTEMKSRVKSVREDQYVFPGKFADTHLVDLKNDWKLLCATAKLTGVRLHDIRHTYASHLASSGVPLAFIGKLLGHSQAATTARYAHLADSPLRDATNQFAAIVERKAATK